MKIAVVGAGISGLLTASLLSQTDEITVFETNDYAGGHTQTAETTGNGTSSRIDTGFIVYNEETYPNFTRLLKKLAVPSQPSNMSFSVRCQRTGLEYNGTSLNGLFAQRRNLLKPDFLRMIRDIIRFYRESPELLKDDNNDLSLGDYLGRKRYSEPFIKQHIIPMGSAIWSSGPGQIQKFPAHLFVRFFHNHGFLQLRNRPGWRTITGGSSRYVEELVKGFADRIRLKCPVLAVTRRKDSVEIVSAGSEVEKFDQVVIATHGDQALRLLADAKPLEREILGQFAYQTNDTILHTDTTILPRTRRAWASWNYFIPRDQPDVPTVTYYMNSLQSLRSSQHFCVTLNRAKSISPDQIIKRITYHHPIFTSETRSAQNRWREISGVDRTHFCGAYWGYGFHEDGVNSALRVCEMFGRKL